jgi:hypothetical protein
VEEHLRVSFGQLPRGRAQNAVKINYRSLWLGSQMNRSFV